MSRYRLLRVKEPFVLAFESQLEIKCLIAHTNQNGYGHAQKPTAMSEVIDNTEVNLLNYTLREGEGRYRELFESAPIAIHEENLSRVKTRLDALNIQPEQGISRYLDRHPELVSECADLLEIVDANRACLTLHDVEDKAEFLANATSRSSVSALNTFKRVLIAIHRGVTELSFETFVVHSISS